MKGRDSPSAMSKEQARIGLESAWFTAVDHHRHVKPNAELENIRKRLEEIAELMGVEAYLPREKEKK